MKPLSIIVLLLGMCHGSLFSQLYITKTGLISFHSHTFLEDIDAVNNKVYAVIDIAKKNIAFSLLQKEFSFKKKLMQEHFNENYVESDKYPKASFNGSFTGDLHVEKEGAYPLQIKGKMTMHGVSREIEIPATITVMNGVMTGTSTFKLNPKDFNISIPFIVRDKIEKENTVKVKIDWIIKK